MTRNKFLHTSCFLNPHAQSPHSFATDAHRRPATAAVVHVTARASDPPTDRAHQPPPHRYYTLAAAALRCRGRRMLPARAAAIFATAEPRASSPSPRCYRTAAVAVAPAAVIVRPRRGDATRAPRRVPARR